MNRKGHKEREGLRIDDWDTFSPCHRVISSSAASCSFEITVSTQTPPSEPIAFAINAPVAAHEIVALREAVGWGGLEADYPATLAGYWATVAGRGAGGALVAWCAVLSDGVRHAVLLDVIVHPRWQRQGVGQALAERAVAHVAAAGITIVHVDFLPEHAGFYERCGFQTGLGGIRDLAAERLQV